MSREITIPAWHIAVLFGLEYLGETDNYPHDDFYEFKIGGKKFTVLERETTYDVYDRGMEREDSAKRIAAERVLEAIGKGVASSLEG